MISTLLWYIEPYDKNEYGIKTQSVDGIQRESMAYEGRLLSEKVQPHQLYCHYDSRTGMRKTEIINK